ATGPRAGRGAALLSNRTDDMYSLKPEESASSKTADFTASSDHRYQGDKLVRRFNAYSYWYLTKAMDSHHLGRGRDSVAQTLSAFSPQTLVVGIPADVLFPPSEQEFIAAHIPGARYYELHSDYGHDGFLIETGTIRAVISDILTATERKLGKYITEKTYIATL